MGRCTNSVRIPCFGINPQVMVSVALCNTTVAIAVLSVNTVQWEWRSCRAAQGTLPCCGMHGLGLHSAIGQLGELVIHESWA